LHDSSTDVFRILVFLVGRFNRKLPVLGGLQDLRLVQINFVEVAYEIFVEVLNFCPPSFHAEGEVVLGRVEDEIIEHNLDSRFFFLFHLVFNQNAVLIAVGVAVGGLVEHAEVADLREVQVRHVARVKRVGGEAFVVRTQFGLVQTVFGLKRALDVVFGVN